MSFNGSASLAAELGGAFRRGDHAVLHNAAESGDIEHMDAAGSGAVRRDDGVPKRGNRLRIAFAHFRRAEDSLDGGFDGQVARKAAVDAAFGEAEDEYQV